jgi:hypothetical protein
MKFTIILPPDLAMGMIFAPCIIWTIGSKKFWNPHRENPHYLPGDFQKLIEKISTTRRLHWDASGRSGEKIFIIVHEIGHGTEAYLENLLLDIKATGYSTQVCR